VVTWLRGYVSTWWVGGWMDRWVGTWWVVVRVVGGGVRGDGENVGGGVVAAMMMVVVVVVSGAVWTWHLSSPVADVVHTVDLVAHELKKATNRLSDDGRSQVTHVHDL
jgi:hypothetical protein